MFTHESLVNEIEEVIKKDFIDDILLRNFNKKEHAPYEFSIDKSIFNRRQIMKELLIALVRGNLQLIGKKTAHPDAVPDIKALFDQLNIPWVPPSEGYRFFEGSDVDDPEDDEVSPLDDKIQEEDDNNQNRQTKRQPRTVKDGNKETIQPGA